MANVCFECSLTSCAFRFHSNSITVIGLIHAALSLSTLHDRFKSGALCNTEKSPATPTAEGCRKGRVPGGNPKRSEAWFT